VAILHFKIRKKLFFEEIGAAVRSLSVNKQELKEWLNFFKAPIC
jgi:hypothetical protein